MSFGITVCFSSSSDRVVLLNFGQDKFGCEANKSTTLKDRQIRKRVANLCKSKRKRPVILVEQFQAKMRSQNNKKSEEQKTCDVPKQ